MYSLGIFLVLLCHNLVPAASSVGDRSNMYQNCLKFCIKGNCTNDGYRFSPKSSIQQDFWCKLIGWTCSDECRYICMWNTVEKFQAQHGYVPKFHGKWPFTRMLGMQEPASAIASMLNLATNAYMYGRIRSEFTVRKVPIVLFWHGFALVCMNAWMWSTIFHTRDTDFTEFMDYACALSMVMGLFIAVIVRLFHNRRKFAALLLVSPLLFFVTHAQRLYSGRIDYDHNMKVNILFGVVGSIIWLCWSFFHYLAGRRYMWRMIAFTLLSGAALSLEVLDFPPNYNFDAHALWHLATVPLPLLFYQFVIDDLRWMQGLDELDLKMA
ncbi:post-GPI attachment to proteins factor 3 [Manduca sexta]|uniref:post-GPI attachment to proteins factor 3 n=1 Tax=Manduca sexta TaxID=7130 RepID=UPI001183592A|nr:post-GPI attachment to proteins factor 3 [Manduca sexta]XP_037295549.1 post-GPI attachment to proteins factor 3 [Manduca sexta]XP_037295550.1 post-GPI attachment to proteins factor 3 [Manduca sexta]